MITDGYTLEWCRANNHKLPYPTPFPIIACEYDDETYQPYEYESTKNPQYDRFVDGYIDLLDAIHRRVKLSTVERKVMAAKFNELKVDLTWKEIGEVVNMSHEGARKVYLRVIKKIKREIK